MMQGMERHPTGSVSVPYEIHAGLMHIQAGEVLGGSNGDYSCCIAGMEELHRPRAPPGLASELFGTSGMQSRHLHMMPCISLLSCLHLLLSAGKEHVPGCLVWCGLAYLRLRQVS
jgi:hypothetical protein